LTFKWEVLLLPALGGLASGVVVYLLCPAATGHGTDVLVKAFHRNMGKLSLKAPAVKGVAAVGVISCGGSAGPEGPVAAVGAAIGSSLGRLFGVTPRERRILLVAGCGAGVGAIFQCPLGGALFAASILYREPEFESDAIVPAVVSSVVGYSTFMAFWGYGAHMLQGVERLVFTSPVELVPYALLGPLSGALSIFFYYCVNLVEHQLVPWSRLPRWLAPALGGLATGALACAVPQVMDGRYLFIQNALEGQLFPSGEDIFWWRWVALFGAVMLVKCLATACTVGSGASGGLLGPSVFIGGAAGAFVGALCEAVYPGTFPEPLRQSLIPVGMGGVLAASMRTPLAAIVMVTEMTGSYGLIAPLMLVCVSAYVVGRGWGLNAEQVRGVAESPAHAGDAVIHMLESWRVGQLMERDWALTASPDTPLGDLVKRVHFGTRPVFAVLQNDQLVGLVSVADIHRITEELPFTDAVIAMDMMTGRPATVYPDQDIYQVLNEFNRTRHDVLPVVSRDDTRRWLGMLTRERVFDMVRQQIESTQKLVLREHKALAAFEQEGQMHELVVGMTPAHKRVVQRLLVPLQAVGKSLRQADFRRAFGAQVIAVEQPDGSLQCPPDIDAPLQTNQRLVALVEPRETQTTG
jgi:CIC family chloride channel protein